MRPSRAKALPVLLLLTSACAHAAGRAAGAAAKSATTVAATSGLDEILTTLEQPENQARIRNISAAPGYEDMAQRIATGLTQVAMSPEGQARLARLMGAITSAVTRQASAALREQLGPALHEALVRDAGPALEEVLRGPAGEELARTTRELGKQAALGAADGVFTGLEGRTSFDGAERIMNRGIQIAMVVGFIALTALLGFVAWMFLLIAEARRARVDSERRETELLLLLRGLRETGHLPSEPAFEAFESSAMKSSSRMAMTQR